MELWWRSSTLLLEEGGLMINQYSPYSVLLPQQEEEEIFVAMVSGEGAAQMYPVKSGKTGILIDFDSNKFWVKSTKKNGMPEQMRRFSFTEDEYEENKSKYVTADDLKKFEDRIMKALEGKSNVQQSNE